MRYMGLLGELLLLAAIASMGVPQEATSSAQVDTLNENRST